MSDGSALNVRELPQLLAEQQAALGKLQQLVVEDVLSENRPDPPTVDTLEVPEASDSAVAPPVSVVISPTPETVAPPNPDGVLSTLALGKSRSLQNWPRLHKKAARPFQTLPKACRYLRRKCCPNSAPAPL
jgi:hypothetical protein